MDMRKFHGEGGDQKGPNPTIRDVLWKKKNFELYGVFICNRLQASSKNHSKVITDFERNGAPVSYTGFHFKPVPTWRKQLRCRVAAEGSPASIVYQQV